ncbi:SpoIIE family protein phosphatase [Rapidithrix thailandica]|uniref:SpoIIE family protein phosphatase n=1 Tax=Rapidithrix thailandica TaxID=413964 RepID=A0AAW9S107_9BACT
MNKYNCFCIVWVWLFSGVFFHIKVYGQTVQKGEAKSLDELITSGEFFLNNEKYIDAFTQGISIVEVAKESQNLPAQGRGLLMTGKAAYRLKDYPTSLNYLLKAQAVYEQLNDTENSANAHQMLGNMYLDWGAFEKSQEHLTEALALHKANRDTLKQVTSLQNLGQAYVKTQNYSKANGVFQDLLTLQKTIGDKKGVVQSLKNLASLSALDNNYEGVIFYNEKILEENEDVQDPVIAVNTHNNLGLFYLKEENKAESIKHFQEALRLFSTHEGTLGLTEDRQATLLINMAVAKSHLFDFKGAHEYFEKALELRELQEHEQGLAEVHNFMAANFLVSNDLKAAYRNGIKAVDYALAAPAKKDLADAYHILSEVLAREEDYEQSQYYYKKHQQVEEELQKARQLRQKELERNQREAEKKENELKLLIAEQEKQAMAMRQLQLEGKQKEQELELLKQQKELQESRIKAEQLERERVAQALAIARQRLEAEKRNKEIVELQREKQLQELQLRQTELEEAQKAKAIELLTADKKLKEQKLKEEETQRKYMYGIAGILGLGLTIIVIGLLQKQKANKKLKFQQELIQEKNKELVANEEELKHNMEELEATQEEMALKQKQLEKANVILEKNESKLKDSLEKLQESESKIKAQNEVLEGTLGELEAQNQRITHSLKYAERMQEAILPTAFQINEIFDEHFVIFRPKDIVSGDFYWLSQVEKKVFVAVVDCTGHGVPGAFMSMIGNTILNQVIKEENIHSPEKILEALHLRVVDALKQKDSQNMDGMDIGLCCIEKLENEKFSLKFSGAKCPLFLCHKGEILKVSSDRKSIGGRQNKKVLTFNCEHLLLEKGDILYLTTDGIIDTGNQQRERFGTKRLLNLLNECNDRPLSEQKVTFLEAIDRHQGNADQRDDVTLFSLKV